MQTARTNGPASAAREVFEQVSSQLLDLDPLTERAGDLVAAARRAGADGADAVAAWSLSRQA